MRSTRHCRSITLAAMILFAAVRAPAQANLPLYLDHLVNGFQDWGYTSTRILTVTNAAFVHSGTNSISVLITNNFGALALEQNIRFDSRPYASLSFWINGGPTGGQQLRVYASLDHAGQSSVGIATPAANTWQQVTVSLSALGVASKTNLTGIAIQAGTSGAKPVFYVDDIQLVAAPAPAAVQLRVDAAQTLRKVDARMFGVNTATWDGQLANATTNISLLREMGCLTLRWPGGSTSDGYHWATDTLGNSRFRNIATNLGARVFTTVNYGSGTSNEAAAWVRNANITNGCNFKYWEIGNECYGPWETDVNTPAHDPYTYAVRTAGYLQLMKAADPGIKVGIVIINGEESYSNNATHFQINPRTGKTVYGWTPIVLATLKSLGVTPDFAVYHVYPQFTDPNIQPPPAAVSDPILLQASANWTRDAADLRQQITDYFGAGGENIELLCTENNSDPSSAFGRQLTSIVNALYLADSVCQLMRTEFSGHLWWDWRNGPDSSGSFDPTIYGWRTYGDEGLLNGLGDRYPMFYAAKILQYFARPDDTVLNATTDYSLLGIYAARSTNGALTLLAINKDAITNLNAQISFTNFIPAPGAVIRSYGIAQDEAVRTNGPVGLRDIQLTNISSAASTFTYAFPPYSLTVLTLAPAAPRLVVLALIEGGPANDLLVLQLQGQANARYVLQSSTNFYNWISVATNTPAGTTWNVTNSILPGAPQRFWRGVWQP